MKGKKDKEKIIRTCSVRDVVEFLFRNGSLDTSFGAGGGMEDRAQQGTRGHKKVQENYEKGFEKEVFLSATHKKDNISLHIQGRADGVYKTKKELLIDEIKTTRIPLQHIEGPVNEKHLKQGMCYGYMLLKKHKRKTVTVRLTYFNLDTEKQHSMDYQYTMDELKAFFKDLAEAYIEWLLLKAQWEEKRDASIRQLEFPYGTFRKGQRKFSVSVFKTIKDRKNLFAQAPTGIGKTLATLFPSLKAIGSARQDPDIPGGPIFYLTSKTITRQVAEDTLQLMRQKGLALKSITLTAKEKICTNTIVKCNPYNCPFAKGHFDRINEVLYPLVRDHQHIDRELLQTQAQLYKVCPYELALDAALFMDCIICDYNYLFDPRAYLRRFFEESGDYIFLIDEAHNLPERARDMYSTELTFDTVRKVIAETENKAAKIEFAAKKLEDEMNFYMLNDKDDKEWTTQDAPADIKEPLEDTLREMVKYLIAPGHNKSKDILTDLFFELNAFNTAYERYDRHYITKYNIEEDAIRLFCIDPVEHLRTMRETGKASVFFSATLSPIDYYIRTCGGNEDDYKLTLRSPFPPGNFGLLVNPVISTKYHSRERSIHAVIRSIEALTEQKGNYICFFPSYKYMNLAYEQFQKRNPGIKTAVQETGMLEIEREQFLRRFHHAPDETFIAFALMGGIFGEGIDLVGERLSGAVIVGVGIPRINYDRDLIKDFYETELGKGWEYAYIYPGANKVMQAVGRVIRSPEDRGIVLLIDSRFTQPPYPRIFPPDWEHARIVKSPHKVRELAKQFWSAAKKGQEP